MITCPPSVRTTGSAFGLGDRRRDLRCRRGPTASARCRRCRVRRFVGVPVFESCVGHWIDSGFTYEGDHDVDVANELRINECGCVSCDVDTNLGQGLSGQVVDGGARLGARPSTPARCRQRSCSSATADGCDPAVCSRPRRSLHRVPAGHRAQERTPSSADRQR